MNLLHLQYFYVVAQERGFTNAAKVLRIQQPAISRMVKLLEDDFGFPLFERIGRRVQLTTRGQEVFESCQRIFGEVDQLKTSVGQLKGECSGPLAFAAAEPIASHFVPERLASFLKDNPLVYPQIFSGPAASMFERILNGELEFGLFFHTPEIPERLELRIQKNVRFHVVIRKDLKKEKSILTSFIGSREIDDTANRRYPTLEKLKRDLPETKIKISSNNLTAHKKMVEQGLGISILPDFLIEKELKKGTLVDLYPKENFIFQMKLVKRKSSTLSLNAKTFLA